MLPVQQMWEGDKRLPASIFLLTELRWLTLQKKNIQQIRKIGFACSLGTLLARGRVRYPPY